MTEPTFTLRTLYNYDLVLNFNLFISIMDVKKYIFKIKGIPIKKIMYDFSWSRMKKQSNIRTM
jgi:hypothetical protein